METFSRDELIAAMRLALDEEDAVALAEGACAIGEEARTRAAASGHSVDEQACIHLAAMNLSEDTLVLLALASAKGARSVEAFRQWRQSAGGASAESRHQDDERWYARYALLSAALPTAPE